MLVHQITETERNIVHQELYKEWGRGTNVQRYHKQSKKEEEQGKRYVLLIEAGKVGASVLCTPIPLSEIGRRPCYLISSLLTPVEQRKQGYGKHLLQEVLHRYQEKHPNASFFLYADVSPSYYRSVGFQEIPSHLQHTNDMVCMGYNISSFSSYFYFANKKEFCSLLQPKQKA